MNSLRQRDVKYLKGVGPARAKLFEQQLGIKSVFDLLQHFPTAYIDRSRFYRITEFRGGETMPAVQVRGRFVAINVRGEGAKRRLVGLFSDGSHTMEVVWFRGVSKLRDLYHTGVEYVLFGKPSEFNGTWSMVHPEVDRYDAAAVARQLSEAPQQPVYSIPEVMRNRGITQRLMRSIMSAALATLPPNPVETLPDTVVKAHRLMAADRAYRTIHTPGLNPTELEQARLRLKFEELFYLQIDILRYARSRHQATAGFVFGKIGRFFNRFYNECLRFDLTGAQKRVMHEIRADVATGRQMNRLVQGDVGSGKTIVALMSMLIAVDNGYQACLMAPTEILAAQHFDTLSQLVAPIGINIKLLMGSTGAKARREIHSQLADGSLHILVGTHALLEDTVQFRKLGLAVIDEQHRFGVAQRARLWHKNNDLPPHVLVMTATPIPRTLAMTVYGDLEVSVIDELPPGRKPVDTVLRFDSQRDQVYRAIGAQLRQGRQVYVVYPLIEENEKLDLRSLEEGYDTIREIFRHYNVTYVHGRMTPAAKEYQMQRFVSGEVQILVATTVIEVGVNVPNATVMVIENAERFGLSQLHQLRGRVGRGADSSYCILMAKQKLSATTRERLELMTRTTDGFVIAEADMRMRGPGDIDSTLQSGSPLDLRIASLSTDGEIMAMARNAATAILDADPGLTSAAGAMIRRQLQFTSSRSEVWSQIS